LLFFTDPWLLAALVAGTLFIAIDQRQWRFAAVTAVSPLVAIALPQILKPPLGRESGHDFGIRAATRRRWSSWWGPHIGTRAPPNLTRVNPDCDLRHSEG
jgi:hypothetical protein